MLQALSSVATLLLSATMVFSLPVPDGTWPVSQGSVTFDDVYTIKAGEVFDGKMQTFDRFNLTCHGQEESGNSTAVFLLEAGATLKNAIIGVNQMEGVHCDYNDCTIENVWWDDVCEDALSVKGGNAASVTRVLGGGARYADDKVIQHNGLALPEHPQRVCRPRDHQGAARGPKREYRDDERKLQRRGCLAQHLRQTGAENYTECGWSRGVQKGGHPLILGNGPKNPVCQYSMNDIHLVNGKGGLQQQQDQQQQEKMPGTREKNAISSAS
ncbi:hypothetical protein ON010_g9225 [Phytophthora cinnamomi]|nr:hypothetical protein ON010_g9225 [Phytophthora cinnamomi]